MQHYSNWLLAIIKFRSRQIALGVIIITVLGAVAIWSYNVKFAAHTEKAAIAYQWAHTWQTRDGKTRYTLMSSDMQKSFKAQQFESNGASDIWSIRWSSPWVESFTINLDGIQAAITYRYTDSTKAKYIGVERLSLAKQGGKFVVVKSFMEKELEPLRP